MQEAERSTTKPGFIESEVAHVYEVAHILSSGLLIVIGLGNLGPSEVAVGFEARSVRGRHYVLVAELERVQQFGDVDGVIDRIAGRLVEHVDHVDHELPDPEVPGTTIYDVATVLDAGDELIPSIQRPSARSGILRILDGIDTPGRFLLSARRVPARDCDGTAEDARSDRDTTDPRPVEDRFDRVVESVRLVAIAGQYHRAQTSFVLHFG